MSFGFGYGGNGGFGFGGAGFGMGVPQASGTFKEDYKAYPLSFHTKDAAAGESGQKIILPSSALDTLSKLNVQYPMQFKISSKFRSTHVGVLEFSANEGHALLPYWLCELLLIEEGSYVTLESVKLPLGTFVKLKPQSVSFLDISNPKAVLEHVLRNFSCLTLNDTISISYDDKTYLLDVVDLKPAEAVSIVEADLVTDFDEPHGYQKYLEEQKQKQGLSSSDTSNNSNNNNNKTDTTSSSSSSSSDDNGDADANDADDDQDELVYNPFEKKSAFTGEGYRLDGKDGKSKGKAKAKAKASSTTTSMGRKVGSSAGGNRLGGTASSGRSRLLNSNLTKTKSGTKGDDYWANLGKGNSLK